MPNFDLRLRFPAIAPLQRGSAAISGAIIGLSFQLTASATATYGKIGLGALEARMLLVLDDYDAVKAAELSGLLKSDPSAISRTAKTLRDRDLVTYSGPRRLLCLTEAGKAMAHQVRIIADEREERLFAGITPEETQVLAELLDRLLANSPNLAELAHRLQRFLAV